MKKQVPHKKAEPGKYKRIIFLALDSYDDLFSDFDNRPFAERTVSDDFVYELRKLSFEDRLPVNEIQLELNQKHRDPDTDEIISKRIHAYLMAKKHLMEKEQKKRRTKGILFLLSGLIMLFIASALLNWSKEGYLQRLLFVVLEPSGWFFAWTGMDVLFLRSSEHRKEEDFLKKVADCKISFCTPGDKA